MKYNFLQSRITAPFTLLLAALLMALTAAAPAAMANEQQRWTGHIDNQAYLDRYYGRSSKPVSIYMGGSSTGYSHRPGYGGGITVIVEKSRHNTSYGIGYRSGNSSIIYHNGYRPNYSKPYRRVHVKPRYYYKPGQPRYDKRYYKQTKPYYGKPHYKRHHRPVYVAPKHPSYKSRHNQRYQKHRIQSPRRHGYSNHRSGSRR